jgi:hypothetical protein
MSVTLNASTYASLKALPISYQAENIEQGIVVRAWEITGLVKAVDAASISNLFEAWTATRKTEPDSLLSGTTGTTVAFTGAAGGRTWSTIACWFSGAPSIEPVGNVWRVSLTVVHAAEALEALLRSETLRRERENAFAPTFASITIGTVALTIIEEPEGRGTGPFVTTAATGTDLIEGPLRPVRIRNIVGYGPNAGRTDFDTLLSWYDTIVTTRPASGTWFPLSPPTAEPQVVVIAGAKVSRWVISLQLRYIE